MNYDDLLKKAFEDMPDSTKHRDRFQIPKVSGHIEGNKTVIKNFGDIAKTLERDVSHMSKFLFKELATPGTERGNQFIFGRKLNPELINERIKKYADNYVFCPNCGKPDTELKKEKEITSIICKACGEKNPVKGL